MTDPISDLLTRIRNALAVKKAEVLLPHSKFKANLADLLVKQGWLVSAETVMDKDFKFLKLTLKYEADGEPVIGGLRRMSKPGQRLYAGASKIPSVKIGIGSTIVSTSKGLMIDKEARKKKLGGEVVCQIW